MENQSPRISRIDFQNSVRDVFFISAGVVMASIGLKGFLLPNGFLDGGAMGIALLTRILSGIDLSILIVLVNLPFILLGIRQVSFQFAVKSSIAIVALAILVHLIELPTITSDKLLIAVFGGFFLGAGIGLSIRGGGVIDGTEVLAITVSRKSSLTVGDFISIFNVILFAFAALLVSIETAMYSMLTYITASKTVDFIIHGIEEYIGVMIVSDLSDEIKHKVTHDLGRGVTVFRSDEGFGKKGANAVDKRILFCAITRLEVAKLVHEVDKVDPDAFIVQYPIKDTKGGMIKKRPLH
ncbi:YitT family protein [Luteirhabdus pelagi]|uniref:YitT family protein n=1 Tax=Luteirhabdus pelagi TaxID=2792783 RepID=UPI00193A642C|nr:YitT family protein [Luteirhabdus pelagi]